jgi:hypothetical protein
MADFLRMMACGLLLAVGCGKPAAVPDASGGTGGTPDDGPAGSDDANAGANDARMLDARMLDARMLDARMLDAPLLDTPGHTGGAPSLGAHAMNFYHLPDSGNTNPSSITTPTMATQTGSMIVVAVGRGLISRFVPPVDNKGNAPYQQIGDIHNYVPLYPNSGTGVYAFPSANGGPDFAVSTSTDPADEITLAAIEVVQGTRIQAFEWNELNDTPATSNSVTTTGPATLIALWWGDGFFYNPPQSQMAIPDNGFMVIEKNTQEVNAFVQCAVAVKNVPQAGTYNVTWTATPAQGAQLWLIAVQ